MSLEGQRLFTTLGLRYKNNDCKIESHAAHLGSLLVSVELRRGKP